MTIKGQALTDFTYAETTEVARTTNNVEAAKPVEVQGEKNSVLMKEDAV